MSTNELVPLLGKALAHLDCASKIFIDIEKKLAGVNLSGTKSKKKHRVTSERTAEALAKSMNRRNIKPKQ